MKIVLYGLTQATMFVAKSILKKHEVIGISDSFAHIEKYGNYKFIEKDKLFSVTFDFIVICNVCRNNCDSIKQSLVNELGIDESKIISFYALFFEERVDQIMMKARANNTRYTGMILGLSHSYQGINPEYLDGKWCSLSIPSEDIYYHEKVFRKCLEQYRDVIDDLNEVIIDLYDYPVFGNDISLSKHAGLFWGGSGGYTEDLHNFSKNTNYYDHDIENVFRKENFFSSIYARNHREIRKALFDEKMVFTGFESGILESPNGNFYKEFVPVHGFSRHISELPDLRGDLYYALNVRDESVKENTECLYKLLSDIRELNKDMKIYFVLIPRYKRMEIYHEKLLDDRRDMFYSIINPIIEDEHIPLLNYKSCESIASNNHFFNDPAHLNYYGAIAFTTMLNDQIHH